MSVSLRFGGYQGEKSVHTRALRIFATTLAANLRDGAEVAVTANVSDHGHKAADVLGMVARGEMDVCYFQSSYLDTAKVASLRVLDLPFLFTDRARIYALLDGALGARLAADIAAATPYRVLAYWDNGFRHMSNIRHPIAAPADCAGLRMRTTASALHQEIFASFGFVPMAIDPADLPAAVAEQRVDAQENPLTNFVNFGIHRHHKHVTLSSHFFGCAPLLINRARYDALAPAAREALHDAAAQATAAQRGFALGEDSECRRLIVAEGARIVETADVDVAAFRAASAALVKRETDVIGRDVMAMLEVLRG